MATITSQDVVNFFTGLGYTPQAAAAIAGHLQQESSLDASVAGDKGTAFGLGQWRGDRLDALKDYAKARGANYRDAKTQLGFIDAEMRSGKDSGARRAYAGLQSAKTVKEATAAFMHYERPSGYTTKEPEKGHGWNNRLANAQSAMPGPKGLQSVADVTKNAPQKSVGQIAIEYSMGPNRPNKPANSVVSIIANSVQAVLGPDAKVVITSGTEPAGKQYGSNRHSTGKAADLAIYDAKGKQVTAFEQPQVMAAIAQEAAKRGALGIGWGTDYMSGAHMHVDMVEPGKNQANTWGNLGRENRGQIVSIIGDAKAGKYASLNDGGAKVANAPFSQGGLLSPVPGGLFVSAAVADTMKDTAKGKTAAAYQQAANTMKDAGVSGIGGGLLGKTAPPSATVAARGAAQAGIGNPMAKAAATGSLAPAPAPPPSPANLAAAYGELGKSLADANQRSLSGALADPNAARSPTISPMSAPVPAVRAIQQVAPVQRQALAQTIAPPVPRAMPVQRAMPVAPAPVARSAPAQSFGPPMATAMDVWSGRAPMGMANNGNVLSERNGNVYSYNPTYDRTSIFNAAGDVVGSFKGREQQGLLGTDMAGFGDKLGGMFAGRNSQFGDKARAVTGAVAGGLLGNYVAGPLGGAIGAALGKEIAAGRNPFEGGLKGLLSAATGRGSFPEAPPAPPQTSGPGLGTNLSQQAKDAIAAGKGGLY